MFVLGVSGSPRGEKSSTLFLLTKALEAAAGVLSTTGKEQTTELLDLTKYQIRRCTGCDACVRKKPCPESEKDDMPKIEEKLRRADGIIIGAPSYFTSVPGILKDFMDRSRPLKMLDNQLKDKVFGAITYGGLRYGGQEPVVDLLNRYALVHGMIVVGAIGNPAKDGTFGSGCMQTDDGKWRSSKEDQMAIDSSALVGLRVARVVKLLKGTAGQR
jgi:multimeric flavodoxin WrbA